VTNNINFSNKSAWSKEDLQIKQSFILANENDKKLYELRKQGIDSLFIFQEDGQRINYE
jgi:hypothetical protein